MKVIITKRFEKEYLDDLSKYFTKNDLVEFLKERSYTFIHLHYPYFKIKNRINNFAFR
ncbi:MAG: hypothetical protein LBQ59_04465 [Candidatus Peribacteria bacterium]|jgi:hypothetical protein|nr:hypothetical protein [Candidatus Peribacteria bacterium]